MKNAKYIEVSAAVRYWEDASINGQKDTEGKIAFRNGELWEPIISLENGEVLNWPEGVTASIHYKVCDAGFYWLLDEKKERIAKWKDYYIPNYFLCMDSNGYGDYIIFKIAENGQIINWKRPPVDEEEWEELKEEE